MKKTLLLVLLISGFCLGQKIGNWNVIEKEDPITDERVFTIYTNSNESQNFNYGSKTGKLAIRSTNGKLELIVNWGGFVTTQNTQVTYRIGEDEAKTEFWSMATNNEATFAKGPIEKVIKMREESRALFRVTPYGENPITYSFDISGLDSIINQFPEDFVSLDEGDRIQREFIPYHKPPIPKTRIRPNYPKESKEMGIQGTVIVQVFVNEEGKVTETSILQGIPNTGLDEAAIEAIKKTRFKPATFANGNPVGVWTSIPVNFRLNGTTSSWYSDKALFNEDEKVVLFTMVVGLLVGALFWR